MIYDMKDYENPYIIVSISDSAQLDFRDGIPSINEKKLTPGERVELFKFAFGIYHNSPFFMIDGKYGKDFSIYLNGEELVYVQKKFYLPERQLTEEEKKIIQDLRDKIGRSCSNPKGFHEKVMCNKDPLYLDKKNLNSAANREEMIADFMKIYKKIQDYGGTKIGEAD